MSTEAAPTLDQHQGHVVHIDNEGSKTGMWLFLFTELLLFGGLFLVYGVYRSMYEGDLGEVPVSSGGSGAMPSCS